MIGTAFDTTTSIALGTPTSKRRFLALAALTAAALSACSPGGDAGRARGDSAAATAASAAPCPGDNGGLTLPSGFCATIYADSLGHARHIAVAPNGDVYVNTWASDYYTKASIPDAPLLVALRDTNSDGRADVVSRFGPKPSGARSGGTGVELHGGALYAEAGSRVVRYALASGELAPAATPETIVDGLPLTGDHPQHPFAIDSAGAMYLTSGSASNSCQKRNRTLQSAGDPGCDELRTRAGVWRYDANRTGQSFSPNERFATGIRNAVGITIGPDGAPWSTQHGRDQLAENWPKLYTAEQGQNLPSEELMRLEQGGDYGWPYCYFDGEQRKLVLAPEYGGDGGKAVGDCAQKKAPAAAFPAHWAPNDLHFYRGSAFPAKYRDGVFIAFHGSWNRAPGPQGGYQVVFQPMSNGAASGEYETFANGFAGGEMQSDRAAYRPAGLAEDASGALYVTDDVKGRVWRITYGSSARR